MSNSSPATMWRGLLFYDIAVRGFGSLSQRMCSLSRRNVISYQPGINILCNIGIYFEVPEETLLYGSDDLPEKAQLQRIS